MRLSSVIMLIGLVLAAASCSGRVDKEKEVLSSLLGREIVIPDSLVCRILDTPIEYDISNADYKIITYIDSAGCVPCRMKLASWKEIINEYKGITDEDIEFLMIINAPAKSRDLKIILSQYDFTYPVMFDPDNEFRQKNNLSDDQQFHTLLLDLNNEVIGVGNPAENPKIRDFYRKMIVKEANETNDAPHFCDKPVEALGLVNYGDTVTKDFTLWNTSSDTVTIQGLIPSCDCISASASTDTILPGKSSVISVTMTADSIPGSFIKRVDIFYTEKEAKERLTLCGFSNNQLKY